MFRKRELRIHFTILILVLIAACTKGDKTKKAETSPGATPETSPSTASVAYRAFGNEPFWSVTISDEGLRFDSPADSAGVRFPAVQPVASGDTLHWASKSDFGSIDVRIWTGTCSDGMSDNSFALTSAVRLNETIYTGCGEKMNAMR